MFYLLFTYILGEVHKKIWYWRIRKRFV